MIYRFVPTMIIAFCCVAFACTSATTPTPSAYDNYLQLLEQNPSLGPVGDASLKEIELVKDPKQMRTIEKKTGRTVGIIAKDKYWLWINDPVIFPNGSTGVYGRIVWMRALEGTVGVAVMPILPDGRVVLNRTFRHATRSWEYELPRGLVDVGETVEDAARRETREETGMSLAALYPLGSMAPDTGMTSSVVPVFLSIVTAQGAAEREASEAIAAIEAFTIEELKAGFIRGYMCVIEDGGTKRIHLRDPFLAFALFQANIRGLQ